MSITQRLKKARLDAGLSQLELANKLGIPVRTYRSYEHGERALSTSMLLDICKVLNISSDYLLGRSPQYELSEAISPYKVAVAEVRVDPKEQYKMAGIKKTNDVFGGTWLPSHKRDVIACVSTAVNEKNAAPVNVTMDGITESLSGLSEKELIKVKEFIKFLIHERNHSDD